MQANFVVVGLGNPGQRYACTRHNIGFMLVDLLASISQSKNKKIEELALEILRAQNSQASWKVKSDAATLQVELEEGISVTLFKPLSFMNLSGEPLVEWMRYYKIEIDQLIVVHDEIDLPQGTLRIKSGGGDGGHNGIKSITEQLNTPDFLRVRLGVGRPSLPEGAPAESEPPSVSSWVLGEFKSEDYKVLVPLLLKAREGILTLIKSGLKEAQNRYNR